MPEWLLEVTDVKQYACCPRIVFYRYCLPRIRPLTFLMEEGIRQHQVEEGREERRSLRHYGIEEGESFFQVALQSPRLRLSGRVDLIVVTPSRAASDAEAVVIEYKYSEQKAGTHFKLQLAAYALLVEEAWGIPVKRGLLYTIPRKQVECIPITTRLRAKVLDTIAQIQQMVVEERMPDPPAAQSRCLACEFRRFCNDVV